ncbi:hypothetical protein C7S20_04965 [Christiangramia fulva]|uniref:Lipoprotein n=1 Tax=Christiangramia fulva TaxID=2126553 RepID=A0A2R3Z327_9FLAO|nr:hypothetical protein [Christiangramia fulva]AVR44665.1 hypothetical protein C7S20_04965 [Christiangramia fulva]
MNKRVIMTSFVLGLLFSSCQTEEAINNVNLEMKTTDISYMIHEPDFFTGPSAEIHEPDWFTKNNFEECNQFPEYNGSANLVVTRNDDADYHGDFDFNSLQVAGTLNYCGVTTVAQVVNINWAGVYTHIGQIQIGTDENPADLIVNHGGHFNLFGYVHITGDLRLNDGATLKFIGDDPDKVFIKVDGNIIIDENAVVDERIIIGENELYLAHED